MEDRIDVYTAMSKLDRSDTNPQSAVGWGAILVETRDGVRQQPAIFRGAINPKDIKDTPVQRETLCLYEVQKAVQKLHRDSTNSIVFYNQDRGTIASINRWLNDDSFGGLSHSHGSYLPKLLGWLENNKVGLRWTRAASRNTADNTAGLFTDRIKSARDGELIRAAGELASAAAYMDRLERQGYITTRDGPQVIQLKGDKARNHIATRFSQYDASCRLP